MIIFSKKTLPPFSVALPDLLRGGRTNWFEVVEAVDESQN